MTWTLTAFMLAGAVVTPIAGRLGDLYGHRRILVACLLLFTAGTVAAGLAASAHSFGWLVAGRAVQGTGSGAFPLALGIARSALPPHRLRGAVALVSAVFGIGGSALMLLAGPAAPRIARRAGSRVPFQAGTVCAVAAFALLAWAHGALWEVYAACAVIGVGYGLAFAAIGNLVVENAPPGQTGVATGVNTIVRTVGAAVGAQAVTAILGVAAAIPRGPGGARDPREEGGVDSGNVQVRALE